MKLSTAQLRDVARFYGIELDSSLAQASGYRNTSHMFRSIDGQSYNFILYKDEPEITSLINKINRVGRFLANTSLPVRLPIDERVIRLATSSGARYGSMYNCLPGHTIAWEAYSMKHIKLLGLAAGRLHYSLISYSDSELPAVDSISRTQLQAMDSYFARGDVTEAMLDKLNISVGKETIGRILRTIDRTHSLTSAQPLHLDLVRGNILFGESSADSVLAIDRLSITGILDFEKAAVGPVVFDLARSLGFLYVDCDKPEHKIKKYFIESGYMKRAEQTFTPDDLELLEPLVSFYLMYDFFKLLSQNPYESLADNHHYKRTEAILLSRQLIQ